MHSQENIKLLLFLILAYKNKYQIDGLNTPAILTVFSGLE